MHMASSLLRPSPNIPQESESAKDKAHPNSAPQAYYAWHGLQLALNSIELQSSHHQVQYSFLCGDAGVAPKSPHMTSDQLKLTHKGDR